MNLDPAPRTDPVTDDTPPPEKPGAVEIEGFVADEGGQAPADTTPDPEPLTAAEVASGRASMVAEPAPSSRSLMPFFGWCALALGAVIVALRTSGVAPALVEAFAFVGVSGTDLLLLGVAMLVVGVLVRLGSASATRQREQHARDSAELKTLLEQIAGYQRAVAERPPQNDAEALDRAMLGLQRQDEKLNNLTKALKMYGKPLMEISQQVTELGQHFDDLGGTLGALKAVSEQSGSQLQTIVRSQLDTLEARQAPQHKMLLELVGQSRVQAETLAAFTKESKELPAHFTALEHAVAAVAEQLAAPRPEAGLVQELAARIDALAQTVQRQVTGLEASLARAPIAPIAARVERHADAPSLMAPAQVPEALAHAISGQQKTDSKNVLGAIAKLKSMRS